MSIHGRNSRFFTSSLPTGPDVVLLFHRRSIAVVALIHKGTSSHQIPPTAGRSMRPGCFCKPGTCTGEGGFYPQSLSMYFTNTVVLKVRLLSFIKASKLLTGASRSGKSQGQTRLTSHTAPRAAYLAASSFQCQKNKGL